MRDYRAQIILRLGLIVERGVIYMDLLVAFMWPKDHWFFIFQL